MYKFIEKIKLYSPSGRISGKWVLFLFFCVIVLNLVVLVGYTYYNKRSQSLAYKEVISRQIVDTIHLMAVSPSYESNRIVNISKTKDLNVSITNKPQWPKTMKRDEAWKFEQYINEMGSDFTISVQLNDSRWINFSFHPQNKAIFVQVVVISLETIMAIMLLFFAWYIERFTEPLRQFKKAAEHLGIHLTANPLVEYGPPIVKETAEAMNLMQKRISDLINDRTRMLAAISHDLRTPITRMKLQIRMMQEEDVAKDLDTELNEMTQMIDQILAFTREANTQEPEIWLDVCSLLMSLVDSKVEQGYQVDFTTNQEKVQLLGKPLALKRALVNILNNAVKYANQVNVVVNASNEKIIIIFQDDGPGIPEADLEKVFTPFYRVDQARSSGTGGSGLGLAITQDIIREHGGMVRLVNRPEGGLQVIIEFNKLPKN